MTFLGKKKGTRGAKSAEPTEAGASQESTSEAPREAPRARSKSEAARTPGARPSFMRRGRDARAEMERAEKRAQSRRRAFRFRMKPGDERTITFLDGGLDEDGMLDIGYLNEHTVQCGERWENVLCPGRNPGPDGRTEPCPICESGGDRSEPSYVGMMTVLDWQEWTDKEGKSHQYARRLFVAKLQTLRKLQTKANKLAEREGSNGLVGVTFEVTRSGSKVASVGDDFEVLAITPQEELNGGSIRFGTDDIEALEDSKHALPLDYSAELIWRTADEIEAEGMAPRRDRGFGSGRRANRSAAATDAESKL